MKRSILLLLAALALSGAVLAADAPDPGKVVEATPPGPVDGATAHRLVAAGVKVVDVRTPAEYAAGHVPGAVNVPYDEIGRRAEELGPPRTPLLLYCHSGRRAGIAVQTLKEKGYTRLYDLGAFEKWQRSEPR
ncbi:MAG TPA: rhodanese-like domain-containing protein [Anaeromyxobacter sp.]|nr:rhodanese-like domain-containing protein [Anaeromyxobacter sp.]